MENIRILDCTLRDGGNVNDWDFGEQNIRQILKSLSSAKVDIIELGHFKNNIRNKNKTLADNIEYFNDLIENYVPESSSSFTVMTRPDLFDIRNISERKNKQKLDSIRFAFYPKHINELKEQVVIAKDKGYKVFINPVGISCQSTLEIQVLTKILNNLNPEGISIVDSFGALDFESLNQIQQVFNDYVNENIILGIHLHENKGISFGLACQFIRNNKNKRKIIIDSSIQGMGRVPGNLCSEVILNKINKSKKFKYNLKPIYETIDNVINPIREKITWGYLPHYYLSALANVNRHYAEYFYEIKGIGLSQLPALFEEVKKVEPTGLYFSRKTCEEILKVRQKNEKF